MTALSGRFDIPGQIAIETVMACGFGICVGCAVRTSNPAQSQKVYQLACVDGPVFKAGEVVLDE